MASFVAGRIAVSQPFAERIQAVLPDLHAGAPIRVGPGAGGAQLIAGQLADSVRPRARLVIDETVPVGVIFVGSRIF
jgi:hypothetical protein